MMKKYTIALLVCLTAWAGQAQEIELAAPNITRPAPSVASLMNFTEIPVNTFTGVPEISIPIFHFPTRSKDINVNMSLNYHPAGIAKTSTAGDVGLGWNLFGDAAISRTIVFEPDEMYNNPSAANYYKNPFNDVYSYNFLGHSGRFKILRNTTNDTFSLQTMEMTNLKIDFVIDQQTFLVSSFTIFDENGYKFVFDAWDIGVDMFNVARAPGNLGDATVPTGYVNGYHLTKVYDNNGKELLNYTYITRTAPHPIYTWLTVVTKKVQEITAHGFGKAEFNYDYYPDPPITFKGDRNSLNNVIIKNANNEVLKKYTFTYNGTFGERKLLKKVSEFDKNLTSSRDYKMDYVPAPALPICINEGNEFDYGIDAFGYTNQSIKYGGSFYMDPFDAVFPEYSKSQVLRKMILPTGGSIVYEFESNTYSLGPDLPTNPPGATEDQYYTENPDNVTLPTLVDTSFNTAVANTVQFTITGSLIRKVYFKFDDVPYYNPLNDPANAPLRATYRLTGNGVNYLFGGDDYNYFMCLGQMLQLAPGTYTLTIGVWPNSSTTGTIKVKQEIRNSLLKRWIYGGGLRIRKIRHFTTDVNLDIPVTAIPSREMNYDYQLFNNPNESSGTLNYGDMVSHAEKMINVQACYSNVKVFDTGSNGYTKYTYATPSTATVFDPTPPGIDYTPYSLSYKNGLLTKAEIYDNTNKLLSNTDNTYEFTESGALFPAYSYITYGTLNYTKSSWAKLASSVSKSFYYNPANTVETTQAFTYNTLNKKLASKTATNSKGETLKTNYFYHSGNSTLSQNRIAEIEKEETYRGANILFTSKINYANNWSGNVSYLPQSVETFKGAMAPEIRFKYNTYDEYSNPLEVEQVGGIKVTYIWGYNKTQPIAKIENATYADVQSQVANLQSLSDTGTEANLITALTSLRASLPNAMITTYTYKPLIGISTMTDPKGNKIMYEYDDYNQLKQVKDKDGNILSENQYYYKPLN